MYFLSLKDINKGEQIIFDYGDLFIDSKMKKILQKSY